MSVGSYITSTFSQDIADEIRRLGVQVDLFWEEEKSVYDDFELPANARILEIGSGPGYYTKKLAGRYPDATFVSLEYDKDFSNFQHELFEGELAQRIEIINGDILAIQDLGQFDLVVSRMVLEHLPEPDKVFNKMNSFVKIGGRFLLLDNDFSNHLRTFPRVDELDDLYQAYCNMRVDQGGNPYIGRELPRYFSLAGYSDIQFKTISAHTYKIDKSLFLGAESSAIGMTLVKQGYLDNAIFKKLIINWSKMAHDPGNVMMRELYCAHGVKKDESVGIKLEAEGVQKVAPLQEKKPKANVDIKDLVQPTTEREKQIAEIWCELLGVEAVGSNISFFDIGGESYLIPLIVEALQDRHQIEIEITDIFEYPTVSGLASFIDADKKANQLEEVAVAANRQKQAMNQDKGSNPFARLKKK